MALWYPDSGQDHSRIFFTDQILNWVGTDSEENYWQNRRDPERSRQLERTQWTEHCITYQYNHQGFRCEQFDSRPAGIAIGCSFTEGVGLPIEQTWPSILSSLLDKHIWNLGTGGSSTATNLRILKHYLPILSPQFVVHCVPSFYRFEYRDASGTFVNILPNTAEFHMPHDRDFFKSWFLHEENSENYAHAHVAATQWLCHEHHVPYYRIFARDVPFQPLARDLMHPGVDWQRNLAHQMHTLMTTKPQGE